MKSFKRALSSLLAPILASPSLAAAETESLIGDWSAVASTNEGELDSVVTFAGDGDALRAKSTSGRGEMQFDAVKFDGGKLELQFTLELEENKVPAKILATHTSPNVLEGKWVLLDDTGEEAITGAWEAKRKMPSKFELAGDWKVVADRDGNIDRYELEIEKKADAHSGRTKWGDGGGVEFKRIEVTGEDITLDARLGEGSLRIEAVFKGEDNLVGAWAYFDADGLETNSDQWRATRTGGPHPAAAEVEPPETDIFRAALDGDLAAIRGHIAAGTDVDLGTQDSGATALHIAAFFTHPEIVAALIEAKADVNATNNDGSTPVDPVVAEWSPELEGLYRFIADAVQVELDLDHIKSNRGTVANLLREAGAKTREELAAAGTDEPKNLWEAAAAGDAKAIGRFLESGIDVNAKDPNGTAPLVWAAMFGQTGSAKALIGKGADVDAATGDGGTALHAAAFFAHPEVVELLLEGGATHDLENDRGETPLNTVEGEWSAELEGIYNFFASLLRVEFDLERIRTNRPKAAALLREAAGSPQTEKGR